MRLISIEKPIATEMHHLKRTRQTFVRQVAWDAICPRGTGRLSTAAILSCYDRQSQCVEHFAQSVAYT